jgi:hypothetical protein
VSDDCKEIQGRVEPPRCRYGRGNARVTLQGDTWESYDHEAPLGRLLQDALALPIFDGGNIGVRRRQLHTMLKRPDYEPLLASGAARAPRITAASPNSDSKS